MRKNLLNLKTAKARRTAIENHDGIKFGAFENKKRILAVIAKGEGLSGLMFNEPDKYTAVEFDARGREISRTELLPAQTEELLLKKLFGVCM